MIQASIDKLKPIFSPHFLKFCSVGLSGVVVNLFFLFVFADLANIQNNIASALAIEISIISNFIINESWTFRDRREGGGTFYSRALRFNLVSFIGAIGQWTVFVAMNTAWMFLVFSPGELQAYHGGTHGFVERWLVHPVTDPPEVGVLKYVSQLVGIGVATFWNFLVNFYWTWSAKKEETP